MLADGNRQRGQGFATAQLGPDLLYGLLFSGAARASIFNFARTVQVDPFQMQFRRQSFTQTERKDPGEIRQRAEVQAIVVPRAAASDRIGDPDPVRAGVSECVR